MAMAMAANTAAESSLQVRPWLFIGDSITDAGRNRSEPLDLGDGYVRLISEELARNGVATSVLNRGLGGDRVRDVRSRWSLDVLPEHPAVLTVYVGINDTWRRYDNNDTTSIEDFLTDYRSMLSLVDRGEVDHLVLIEPFLLPVRPDQTDWFEDLHPRQDAVRRLAQEFDAVFVPLQRRLSGAGPAETIATDGVHPTLCGHELIARAWLDTVPLRQES
jgi:acyl-CoA thioesterase-1